MSRLRRIEHRDRIFFLTTNLAPTTPAFSRQESDALLRVLDVVRRECGFLLFGFVVMPDHVHLLLCPRENSLPHLMHQWKFKTGYNIQRMRKRKGPLWQERYFDFICRRTRDFSNKLEYMHENPVKAGYVSRPEEWPWSSYVHYAGTGQPPVVPDAIDFSGDPHELLWPAPWRKL